MQMKSNCRPEDLRADASGLVRRVTVREHPALGRTAARRQVQELFDRSRFGTKIDVPQDQPVYASLLFRSFQDLEFVWASHSPARAARSNGPSGTDLDRVVFGVASAARVSVQTGKSFFLGPGDGILASTSDPGSAIYPSASRHVSVLLPRARISAAADEARLRSPACCTAWDAGTEVARPVPEPHERRGSISHA